MVETLVHLVGAESLEVVEILELHQEKSAFSRIHHSLLRNSRGPGKPGGGTNPATKSIISKTLNLLHKDVPYAALLVALLGPETPEEHLLESLLVEIP